MADLKPSEIIREGKLQLFERGWQRGASLIDRHGSLCALGALGKAAGLTDDDLRSQLKYVPFYDGVLHTAATFLAEAMSHDRPEGRYWVTRSVWSFNDATGRTFDEIIDAFDKAEKFAEQAESIV